mgnify:FL=1
MHNVLWIDSISNFFSHYWNSFDWESILSNIFTKILSLLLLFLIFYFGKKFLHFLFKKTILSSVKIVGQNENKQKTIVKLLENMLDYFLYFILIYWILSIIGVPVSSLIAGAGIAGVALGLSAQGFLTDVINGLFILIEHQFEVGDAVLINTIAGTIASVGIRTTQVRGYDGTLHYIPNRNITVVSNQSRGNMRALIELPLNSNVDLKSVYSVIEEVNNEYTKTDEALTAPPEIFGPQTKPNGQFVFSIALMTKNGLQHIIYQRYLTLYQEALLKQGIDLSSPVIPYTTK